MNNRIKYILENDKKARKTVEAAKEQRKIAEQELEKKKAHTEAVLMESCMKRIRREQDMYSEQLKTQVAEKKLQNDRISENMNRLAAEKENVWTEEIFRRIIGG